MTSIIFSNSILKSKFRGCMIGALIGDCLGNPFDEIRRRNFVRPSKQELIDFMKDIMNGESSKMFIHTDDTRLTICVASSLVDKGEVNAKDMAQKFTTDYFNQKINRRYGKHVKNVFLKLRNSNYADVFSPAKEQFDGTGSYGNGAAMRIAPLALFGSNKGEKYLMDAAKECSFITHYHRDGYRGAILQCFAVNAALGLDSSQELDPISFVNSLLEKMEEIETEDVKPYSESLKVMKEILQNKEDISSEEITECLGNGDDISALKSVPTAIYSFLRGMKPLQDYENTNPFMRTIYFAISLGGDTDTIATMAGAIAGAYYGEDMIPQVVQKQCEAIDEVISLADNLFDVANAKD